MKEFFDDIKDDEIRPITFTKGEDEMLFDEKDESLSSGGDNNSPGFNEEVPLRRESSVKKPKQHRKRGVIFLVIAALGAVIALAFLFSGGRGTAPSMPEDDVEGLPVAEDTVWSQPHYVEIIDTVIGREPLKIYIPRNAVPRLHIGVDILNDSDAVFVVQAADIRRDNGEIVGAYVLNGNLLSRGKSKAGFCAIINGRLTIGVADSTPYFEQAIESDGYFFRQYPLVVGGLSVDNKLKPSSLRRALAEWNGQTVVVVGSHKMTLNEFSQVLVDLGVTNAIYLIGSSANGFAIDASGQKIKFGKDDEQFADNVNYLVWE